MNKFNVNDLVLYQNGPTFELGIVKRVIKDVTHKWGEHDVNSFYYNEHDQSLYLYDVHSRVIVSLKTPGLENAIDDEILDFLVELDEYIYEEKYKYFVRYHTGDTTALTDEVNLHKIKNEYAFLVLRRNVDAGRVERSDARVMAEYLSGYTDEDELSNLINTYRREENQ